MSMHQVDRPWMDSMVLETPCRRRSREASRAAVEEPEELRLPAADDAPVTAAAAGPIEAAAAVAAPDPAAIFLFQSGATVN